MTQFKRKINWDLVKLWGAAFCGTLCLAMLVWFFAHKQKTVQDDFNAQQANIYKEVATRGAILLGEQADLPSTRAKLVRGPSEEDRNQALNKEHSASKAIAALEESLATLAQQSEHWPPQKKQEASSLIQEARLAILIVKTELKELRRELNKQELKAVLKTVEDLKKLKKVFEEHKPKVGQ